MIDELLTEEERLVTVRRVPRKEIVPLVVEAWHREKPLNIRMIAKKFGELGMLGEFIPQEYGCPA